MRHLRYALLGLLALAALLVGVLWSAPGGRAAGNSIVTVDTSGAWTSLALDSSFNPVVSYYDELNDDLRVLHCGNPNCTSGNSIELPDTAGNVGLHTSLALDASGNPVVSYYDLTNLDLKVLHCGNPNCSSGNSVTSPDTEGAVGKWTSLALDRSGHPVVSYFDDTNDDLKVLHCNDPDCAEGDESITSPDTAGNVGQFTSLVLDCSDFDPSTRRCLSPTGNPANPVVSYWAGSISDLKLLHCGNPNCSPGNSITTPDIEGGRYTSLALDGFGNPVVSYRGGGSISPLKLLHCNDASCAGDDESITSPDTAGNAGLWTSLALDDGSGNPVVSYWEGGGRDLRVLHCGDPNCSSGNSVASPDTVGRVGEYTSLVLDGSGHPVVSYNGGGSLKILHCGDPSCGAAPDTDGDGVPDASDNCPAWPNTDQSLPPWPVPADDPDCDGFSTADENFIGTDPNLACGADAWPPDHNSDGLISISDVLLMKASFGAKSPDDPIYDARRDLNPDGKISISDVLTMKAFFDQECT